MILGLRLVWSFYLISKCVIYDLSWINFIYFSWNLYWNFALVKLVISLQIKQPILFLSGLQDEMVPPFHMRLLYAKAADRNRNCLYIDFPTGTHMDTWLAGGDRYWRSIQLFLQQYASEKSEVDTQNGLWTLALMFDAPTTLYII